MPTATAHAGFLHARTEFDPEAEPVLRVAPGEHFVLDARSLLTDPAFETADDYTRFSIPVTGPVVIEDVQPGDLLRIDVHAIRLADRGGMVTLPGRGGFGAPLRMDGLVVPVHDGHAHFPDDVRVPIRPMIGKIGVAPAGESPNSSTVGRYGGNMDCRDIVAGASLFVTAQVVGGLLYAGDLHAVQGDGECSLTAVEMEGSVELSVHVVAPGPVRGPVVFAEGRMIVLGDGETLDEAATLALDETMAIVRADRGWSRERTAMLLSAAADVAVSQLVNARKSIKVSLDERYLLASPFERKED
ncbi:acetamidase/formamidase family protein [Microbacterium sp. ASV81]|uniref:Acetamidase/formamidase family protein n=1 Tax=Microbacterium capsulatum TaxID=3041921 RepID=A0ABU0XKK8_9MICO|nr:acetamidase/formamidase family protein [Microbacterium sp. ASV81]MDQ4214650.1 acetamidase/formamidase family protein [Microbacterium sp. ASV81]